MKKALIFLIVLSLNISLIGCSSTLLQENNNDNNITQSADTNDKTSVNNNADGEDSKIESSQSQSYEMLVYTEAPNENSSIKIQYPKFSYDGFDELNKLIYDKVKSFAKIDTSILKSDAALTIDYKSKITLQNSKIISIVFFGSSSIEGSSYPVNNLIPLNVDLSSMKEITLEDLYNINSDFEKVFFSKAFYPTDPITSCSKDNFKEMLKLQSPEYQTVDPFSIQNNVSCYLKEDGIVLSMPSVHATGCDYFEAQLNYSDVQKFYIPKQNYWEN